MYKSMLISELKIKEKTKKALHHLGYTEIDNFIEADDIILAENLTKCQYIDLAIAIAGIKSNIFWEEIHNHSIQSEEPNMGANMGKIKIEPYDDIGADVYDAHADKLIFSVRVRPSPSADAEEEKIAEICRVALNKFCVLHSVKNIKEYIEQLKK